MCSSRIIARPREPRLFAACRRPPRCCSRPAAAATTSRSRSPRSRRRPPRTAPRSSSSRTTRPTRRRERLVAGHGGRYLAHGAPRGINVARNAAIDAASGELLCFLDDDVEVWPGWLDALLAAAARTRRTRRSAGRSGRGWRARGCARAGASRCRSPRSTSAREDRDAEFAWGANLALRRSALERIGPLRPRARRRGRRGGLAAAAARRGRAHPLRRRGGRRPPPRGRGRALRRALARGLPPRPRLAPLRRLQGRRAAARRRAAHARRLRLAHRAPPLRHRDRADRADRAAGCARRSLPARCRPRPATPDYLSGRSGTLVAHAPPRRARCGTRPRRRAGSRRGSRCAVPRARRRARRVLVLGVARPEHARDGRAACGASSAAPATTSSCTSSRRGPGAGKWANLNALLAAHPAGGLRLAAAGRRRRRAPARLPRRVPAAAPSASACGSRSPRTRSPRTPPGTSRAGAPALLARTDALRRDRAGDRAAPRHVRHAAAVPRPAHGLGPGRPLERRRRRARLADRDRRRDAGPPPAPRRRRLPARRGDGRGGGVPRRPRVRHARAGRRDARGAPGAADARRDRRGVLPAGRRPRARRLGAPPGARRARRRRRRARARPAPPGAVQGRARAPATRGRSPPRCASRCARSSTGSRSATCRSSPRRGRARYGRWGAWAAPSLRLALRRLRREFPYDLVHAHYAAPAGDAVRRARPGRAVRGQRPRRRRAVRRPPPRRRAAGAARRSPARGSCSPTRPRSRRPRRDARRARRRASCTSAPTCPPSARDGGADARDRRPPGRPQAPRGRPARAVAAARLASRAGLDRRRRRPRAAGAGAAGGRARPVRPAALHRRSCRTPRRSRPRAAARCSCCRASTRRSASPTSRRWRRACRRSAALGEPGPEEIAAAGGGIRLVAPGDPEALAAELRGAARRAALAPRARAARRARPSRPPSPGSAAARRPSPPTRRRCGEPEAGPVRHQPRAAVPRRRVPALHEREDVVFALIGGDVRHGGGGHGRTATLAVPRSCGRASAASRGWPPPGASAP